MAMVTNNRFAQSREQTETKICVHMRASEPRAHSDSIISQVQFFLSLSLFARPSFEDEEEIKWKPASGMAEIQYKYRVRAF